MWTFFPSVRTGFVFIAVLFMVVLTTFALRFISMRLQTVLNVSILAIGNHCSPIIGFDESMF